jgi:hypothetical protein
MAQDGLDANAATAALGIILGGRDQWLGQLNSLTWEGYDSERADNDEKRVRFLAGKARKMLKGRASAAEIAALIRTKVHGNPSEVSGSAQCACAQEVVR